MDKDKKVERHIKEKKESKLNKILTDSNITKVFDIALFFYFLLNQLHYIFAFIGRVQFLVVGTINLIGIIMLVVIMYKKMDIKVLITLFIFLLFGIISYITIGNFSIITYVTAFRYLGVAMYLLYYKQDTKITKIIMYTTLILFIPVFFQDLGYNMFLKASRNYYSVIVFMSNFVFNKSFWDLKKKAPILPTIVSYFICLFAGGRAGIISYIPFIIGTLILNFKYLKENPKSKTIDDLSETKELPIITEKDLEEYFKNNKNLKDNLNNNSNKELQKNFKFKFYSMDVVKRELIIFLIIFLIFVSIFILKRINKEYNILDFTFVTYENYLDGLITDTAYGFEEKGISFGTRRRLIKTYVKYAFSDIKYFLNGVKLESDPLFVKYMFNVHNSYMSLHAKAGIGGIILCGYLGFRALFIMIKRKEWGHLLIYLAILARVFVDTAAFPGHLDIIIFYYIFRFYYDFKKT